MGYSILNYTYSINRLLPHPIRWNPPASWSSNFQHRSPEMLATHTINRSYLAVLRISNTHYSRR